MAAATPPPLPARPPSPDGADAYGLASLFFNGAVVQRTFSFGDADRGVLSVSLLVSEAACSARSWRWAG